MDKQYLGDGVYVELRGNDLLLTSPVGRTVIHLSHETFAALERFVHVEEKAMTPQEEFEAWWQANYRTLIEDAPEAAACNASWTAHSSCSKSMAYLARAKTVANGIDVLATRARRGDESLTSALAAKEAAEKRLEEAERDAERYRWLRDDAGLDVWEELPYISCIGGKFDAAIDKARGK